MRVVSVWGVRVTCVYAAAGWKNLIGAAQMVSLGDNNRQPAVS